MVPALVVARRVKLAPALMTGVAEADGGVAMAGDVSRVTADGRMAKLSVEQAAAEDPAVIRTRTFGIVLA